MSTFRISTRSKTRHNGRLSNSYIAETSTTEIIIGRSRATSVGIRIFLTCWLVFALHFATNTVREIYPALSLGDHLSFDVSEYAGLHPDIFELMGRGSFINNNPGASMIGAVPYILFRPVTDRLIDRVKQARAAQGVGQDAEYNSIYPMAREFYRVAREKGFDVKFGLAAGIMAVFAMAPISAFGAVVMFWVFSSITHSTRTAAALSLIYAFATPIFYRTAQLNQNVLLANFALFSFALLWRPWKKDEGQPFYFLAGLAAGFTVVLDYSGIVAAAVLAGYALYRWMQSSGNDRRFSSLVRFAAGGAICGLILMAYQWSSFGNPILPAQSYMPPANFTDLGYRGFSLPSTDLLLETAFGMRYGLFTSAPILLLVFAIPLWARRNTRLLEKPELIFIAAFTLLFFIFCSANQYGRMQFGTGVRHIVPVVPFVFILAANVLIRMPKLPAALITAMATYWSWCLVMYRDVEQGFGVFESIRHVTLEGFRLPWLTTLERMGFVQDATPLPLFFIAAVILLILWSFPFNPTNNDTIETNV